MKSRFPLTPSALLGLFLLVLVGGLAWIASDKSGAQRPAAVALGLGDGLAPERIADPSDEPDQESAASVDEQSGQARRAILSGLEQSTQELLATGPGVEFRGQVLAALGEVPLAGALVHLEGDQWEVQTESAAGGEFKVLVPELDGLRLRATLPGYAPFLKSTDGTQDELVIVLKQEGRIVGSLRGKAMDAPEKGSAQLWDLRVPGSATEGPHATAEIDEEGHFEFGELRTSEYLVCVTYPDCRLSYVPYVAVELGNVSEVSVDPQAGATLTGQVLELDSGEPIVGVPVLAKLRFASLGRIVGLSEAQGVTDEEGRYTIPGLMQAEHRVQVSAPWGTVGRANVAIYEAQDEVEQDFELAVPGSLSGTVVNPQKLGVGHAQVRVTWESSPGVEPEDLMPGQEGGERTVVADTNGLFSLEDLPTGRQLFLSASRTKGGTADGALYAHPLLQMLRPGQDRENVELRMKAALTVRGLVHDQSKLPVAGVEVEVTQVPKGGGRRPAKAQKHSVLKTDADGHFEVSGVVPGTYQLVLRHDGYLPNAQKWSIKENHDPGQVKRIGLHEQEFLAGFVENEFFEAVPYAQVTINELVSREKKRKRSKPRQVRADGFGRFIFDNLVPGEYGVRAKAVGYEKSIVEERVVIPALGELRFELRSKPQVPRSTLIGRLQRRDGEELERVKVSGLKGGSISFSGDAFEVVGVQSGQVKATFDALGCLPVDSGELTVAPGGTLNLGTLFLSPAAEVYVFVRMKDGKPAKNFKAHLVPVDALAKQSGLGKVKLGTKSSRHRFKGTKGRQRVQAGHSQKVPYGKWKLEVRAKGMGLATRTLEFNSSKPVVRCEVEVAPPKKRTSRKKAKKGKKPKSPKKK